MQTTVKLQYMYSYSPIIIFVFGVLLIGFIILIWPKKRKKVSPKKEAKVKENVVKNIPDVKEKYNEMLENIGEQHAQNAISDRVAYQELSKTVRDFVFEVTGIKVQNYTLEEIEKANLPRVSEIITECYAPEFAPEGRGNVQDSVKKARKVIEEWN